MLTMLGSVLDTEDRERSEDTDCSLGVPDTHTERPLSDRAMPWLGAGRERCLKGWME